MKNHTSIDQLNLSLAEEREIDHISGQTKKGIMWDIYNGDALTRIIHKIAVSFCKPLF
jgi:hypothetical protein